VLFPDWEWIIGLGTKIHIYTVSQKNEIAEVKLDRGIEIAQEATSFSNLYLSQNWLHHLVYESLLAVITGAHNPRPILVINTVLSSKVNIGSQIIIEHNHAQIHTEMTAVLQLKPRILGNWKLYFFCFVSVTWNDERNFLWVQSHSPAPQSSSESNPPNRGGLEYYANIIKQVWELHNWGGWPQHMSWSNHWFCDKWTIVKVIACLCRTSVQKWV